MIVDLRMGLPCPDCGEEAIEVINQSPTILECSKCGQVYEPNGAAQKMAMRYKFKKGDWIYIINREHARWLDPAQIIDINYKFYRLRFTDRKTIWMPEHWLSVSF